MFGEKGGRDIRAGNQLLLHGVPKNKKKKKETKAAKLISRETKKTRKRNTRKIEPNNISDFNI